MTGSAQQLLSLFIHYKYLALFPAAIIEGPIASVIAGLLVSSGTLEAFPALIVIYLGDVISDSVFYYIGWAGRNAIEKTRFIKLSESQVSRIGEQYIEKPWQTMILAKVAYGLGLVFMTAAGASNMSFRKFIKYIAILDFIRSMIILAIGFYFGKVVLHFGSEYVPYYIVAGVIIVGLWLLLGTKARAKEKKTIGI